MSSTTDKVKGGKIYVKPFNYLCGIACIGCGALCLLGGPDINIYSWFAPFYFAIFGIMMIASDLNIELIIQNCNFLDRYMGRGLFNIFVGSQILDQAQLQSGTTGIQEIFLYIGTITSYAIMALGGYLVLLHCLESNTSINGNTMDNLKGQAAKAALKSYLK
jgi:hypothetical protein